MCQLIEAVSRETCQTHRSCVTDSSSVCTVSYATLPPLPSPPLLFYGPVASPLGHKPDGKKNSICNLPYGPWTQLVTGIYVFSNCSLIVTLIVNHLQHWLKRLQCIIWPWKNIFLWSFAANKLFLMSLPPGKSRNKPISIYIGKYSSNKY